MKKYGIEHFWTEELETCLSGNAPFREQFWIKQYNSFGKNGYNATIGGDGKSWLDYNKILNLCDDQRKTAKQIANECNCSVDSVKKIAKNFNKNINWDKRARNIKYGTNLFIKNLKKVLCIENGKVFTSTHKAAEWVRREKRLKGKDNVNGHISEVARGERKTAYSFSWKYLN